MAFGETLSNLRKAKGLSQEQLAAELGLTRQTISKWELNQSTPDLDYLVRLSDFFAVSTDFLIKGKQFNNDLPCNNSDLEERNSHTKLMSRSVATYKLCVYLGAIILGVSLIGIIVFVICSALNPWGALIGRWNFEGLIGFLIGTDTLWFFIILLVLLIAGGLISAYGIKNMKQ